MRRTCTGRSRRRRRVGHAGDHLVGRRPAPIEHRERRARARPRAASSGPRGPSSADRPSRGRGPASAGGPAGQPLGARSPARGDPGSHARVALAVAHLLLDADRGPLERSPVGHDRLVRDPRRGAGHAHRADRAARQVADRAPRRSGRRSRSPRRRSSSRARRSRPARPEQPPGRRSCAPSPAGGGSS